MIKKIRSYALSLVMVLTFAAPALVPAIANATCSTTATSLASGADEAAGGSAGTGCSGTGGVSNSSIGTDARNIVSLFSVIVGAVSIIMIIYGGFRYITSGGESTKVGNAKNTLIYAIVGLVIVALAQLIVHFVLNQASNVTQ